jgi:multidrug resistance efflux pump
MLDPWTRDGRVRADIVEAAPDVSGLVAAVSVQDNEAVHTGQPLFQIDPLRFQLALNQAGASVDRAKAVLMQAQSDARRVNALSSNAVAAQSRDQSNTDVREAEAAYQSAVADQAVAQLNLDRATVRATVNGIITNFSIVDTDSLYVDGYFEETKLPRIRIGDTARVTLLGGSPAIIGHVQSLDAGIADTERTESPNLLANINPTFTWVRLAQRVPVRIQLDHVPAGVRLIAGLTATVEIEESK